MVECHKQKSGATDWEILTYTMLPIRLAWAWTVWKAQGQTIRGKIVISLGNKEPEHGYSYVAFSRATKFSDVGIIGGVTEERLTTKISSGKKLKVRKLENVCLGELAKQTLIALQQMNE